MKKQQRTQLVLGIILILVAAWLILSRIFPDIKPALEFSWPVWVILAGALILVIGLLVGDAGMAVPACIVAGVGGILYYQNATSHWETWSYMWTLIPGFVGIGTILSGIFGGSFRKEIGNGLNLLLVSVVLFTIFGTIFGGWTIFGNYADYAPIVLLFLLGAWLIVRGVIRKKA